MARPGVKVRAGPEPGAGIPERCARPAPARPGRSRCRAAVLAPPQPPRRAAHLRGRDRGHQPERLGDRRPEPLRDRPRARRTSRCSRTASGRSCRSSPTRTCPISLACCIDTSASMDEKLPVAQRGGRPLRQDAAAAGHRRRSMQFNDRTTVLQDFTADEASLRGGHQPHGGLGPHRPPQRALRRAQGAGQAEEGGRAAAAGDGAALRRRGHGLAGERRAGAGAGPQDRDQHLRDQPAPEPRRRTATGWPSARPRTC